MIETHVVNALLLPALRQGPFFKVVNFINGLVAPTFLFCAGFAFAITLDRNWDDVLRLGKTFWRYTMRMGFILAVGYMLHLPHFSFRRLVALEDPGAWTPFFQSDILHVIALTLLFLLISAAIARRRPVLTALALASGLGCIFAAPLVRAGDYSAFPVFLRPYLSGEYMSQFPLFPWSAFLLGGAVTGFLFLPMRSAHREGLFMLRLSVLATSAIAGAILIAVLPFRLYPADDFWGPSPWFFIVRSGLVMLLLALLWRLDGPRPDPPRPPVVVRSPVTLFGRESLVVYVVHLLIVYGYMLRWSFVREFSQTLDFTECFALAAALGAAMYLLAFVWHALKTRDMILAAYVRYGLYGGTVLLFLLKDN